MTDVKMTICECDRYQTENVWKWQVSESKVAKITIFKLKSIKTKIYESDSC